ncbi:MAG: DUF6115 domain-containing protein [Acidobacteriota bacterium]
MTSIQVWGLQVRWWYLVAAGLGLAFLSQMLLIYCAMICQRRWIVRECKALEKRLQASVQAAASSFPECSKEVHEELIRKLAQWEMRKMASTERELTAKAGRLEKKHQVLLLARSGLNNHEISNKLRLPRGETELLLDLARAESQVMAAGNAGTR